MISANASSLLPSMKVDVRSPNQIRPAGQNGEESPFDSVKANRTNDHPGENKQMSLGVQDYEADKNHKVDLHDTLPHHETVVTSNENGSVIHVHNMNAINTLVSGVTEKSRLPPW